MTNPNKPASEIREFWFNVETTSDNQIVVNDMYFEKPPQPTEIHAIDYEQYEAARNMALELSDENVIQYTKITSLLAIIKKLTDMGSFYEKGWTKKHARLDEFKVPRDVWKNNVVTQDAGSKARDTLATVADELKRLGVL